MPLRSGAPEFLKCTELSELFSFTKYFLHVILDPEINPWHDFPRAAAVLAHNSQSPAENGYRKGDPMKYVIKGRNLEITDSMREAVEKKLGKLDRFFNPNTAVYVTMSVQKDTQKVEVTIPVKGRTIRAEQASSDMYVSIDLVEEVIERQLKKYKGQLTQKSQSGENFSRAYMELPVPEEEEQSEIRIAKVKKFAYKPMDPDEACLQMELLGHNFYVFTNSETERTNVVYKRNDGSYGLIEPEDR